ncbi:DUF3365 domain-containing protein [Desulfonatronospira sp.]|uniref:c-type heme family protein n=1 Tax=Desulfonatronospira sp. TaxID=1962951 RepID=UPI0025BB33C0|nr:DUF3365 domain-containing protein [Desulfonatronospira sp.]
MAQAYNNHEQDRQARRNSSATSLNPTSWNLQNKFLMGMAAIMLICCLVSAFVIYFHQKRELESRALASSELVMGGIEASRRYVSEELRPKMYELMGEDHFVREAMSTSYVGRSVMERFAPELPGIRYRRVAVNARNPDYEASIIEQDMIRYFQDNRDKQEWQGIMDHDGYAHFHRFKPVVFHQECLHCHGRAEDAPAELIKMYGSERGFGRSQGEIAGVVSVDMPVHEALSQVKERAVSVFVVVFVALSLIFAAMGVLFNRLVVTSLRSLLKDFQESSGTSTGEHTRDELGRLGAGFDTVMQELHSSRAKLQNWSRTLEEEIARTRQELESAQAQLVHSEKMAALGRMTANITHAIRNPLTAMGGFARRLESVAQNDRERKYAGIILKEMRRLEEILNDIVVFSQDRCCRDFQPHLLQDVIREMLEKYREQFQEQGIKTWLDVPNDLPQINMDREKVLLLLENLLRNSMHALPGGGEVQIAAGSLTGENGQKLVRMSLSDTGPGLPEHVLAVLFEPFTTTKDHSLGTGLGLPLCKKIMEEHGGWIKGENLPGKGAVFYLYFPVTPPEQA